MTPDLLLKVDILFNLYFLFLTLYNIRYLNRNSSCLLIDADEPDSPKVSVVLPVRNEERRVVPCLRSLMDQSYENYEIIVVNDNSTDGTARLIAGLAARDPRLTLIDGRPLPSGWNGKSFACSQGVEAATGDYLLFTDADTLHSRDSIAWAVTAIREHEADFASAYVRQRLGNLGELLLVPAMFIMTALLLPLGLIPRKNAGIISFAIGQFIICRRAAFVAMGAYDRFRGSVVEDVSMAREMKRAGYKTIFLDAQGYISCRMYEGFSSAFRGIAKSLFGAINSSVLSLAALTGLIILAIVYPFYAAVLGVLAGGPLLSPVSIPVGLFLLTWLAKMHNRHIPVLAVLLYPLTFASLIPLAIYSAAKTGFGAGLDWKGRLVIAQAREERPGSNRLPIANFSPLYRLFADIVTFMAFTAVLLFARLVLGLEVEGGENLRSHPDRRRMLISNHVLYLDSALVGCAIFPFKTFFSALEKTFSIPVIGRLIRLLGAFPLPEQNTLRRIIEPIERMFAMGRFVHFFPEGELRRLERELGAFKSGVFFLACLYEALVTPVTVIPRERRLLSRFLPGAFRVKVLIQEPLDSRDYLVRYATRSAAVRAMAHDARERMGRALRAEAREKLPTR